MSFLYLRYDQTKEKQFKSFEKYLDCLNFDEKFFKRDENCRILYDGVEFNFFVLDYFEIGIADRIFTIDKNFKTNYYEDDATESKKLPTVKTASGKLFYVSFCDRARLYDELIEKLQIVESEYNFLVRMVLEFQLKDKPERDPFTHYHASRLEKRADLFTNF